MQCSPINSLFVYEQTSVYLKSVFLGIIPFILEVITSGHLIHKIWQRFYTGCPLVSYPGLIPALHAVTGLYGV